MTPAGQMEARWAERESIIIHYPWLVIITATHIVSLKSSSLSPPSNDGFSVPTEFPLWLRIEERLVF